MVVGHKGEKLKTSLPILFYAGKEQLGTAHAVMQAKSLLPAKGSVLILCGDTPLLTAETSGLLQTFKETKLQPPFFPPGFPILTATDAL